MKKFISLVLLMCLASCSTSLKKFGQEKKFLYKVNSVDTIEWTESSENQEIMYAFNTTDNCFPTQTKGDVVTVESKDLVETMNFFFRNRATWEVKGETVKPKQVQYETAFCKYKFFGYIDSTTEYVSIRVVR